MREKLIKLFGLKPAEGKTEVTDEQIFTTAANFKRQAAAADEARKEEKAITDLVTESCGALSRAAAREVLAARAVKSSK